MKGPVKSDGFPFDPFYDQFALSSSSSSPQITHRRSVPVLRIRKQGFVTREDDIYTQTSSFSKKRFSLQHPPTASEDVKTEVEAAQAEQAEQAEQQNRSTKDAECRYGSQELRVEKKDEERRMTYVTDLTSHQQEKLKSEKEKAAFEKKKVDDKKRKQPIQQQKKECVPHRDASPILFPDSPGDDSFSSEDSPARMTVNGFFLSERKKDLAALAKSKLTTPTPSLPTTDSSSPISLRKHPRTKPKLWLTPTKAYPDSNSTANNEIHGHPRHISSTFSTSNVSTTTVNTSILFPADAPSPYPFEDHSSNHLRFPPKTASRFEIQDWLHALFQANNTPPLPPFALYNLSYTGEDLHCMAMETTPKAADLTREFMADLIKNRKVSVAQGEIVYWEILKFGGRGVDHGGGGGRKSVSFGSGRRSGDVERRVMMGSNLRSGKSLDVQREEAGGLREMDDHEKSGEMSVKRKRVRKFVRVLVGLRISVKVEVKAAGGKRV